MKKAFPVHLGWLLLFVLFSLAVGVSSASATTVTFTTAAGATVPDGPVSAEAQFTTGTNSLTILVADTLANPTSVGQLISDLRFTFNTGQTSGTLLAGPSNLTLRTVASGGTFTNATGSAQWSLGNSVSGGLEICIIADGPCPGTPGVTPAHLIIGPPGGGGTYSSANGSIAGNGPHNPFLANIVEFDLTVPGLSATSTVNSMTFSFGTEAGILSGGVVCTIDCGPIPPAGGPVPEPSALLLIGSGVVGGWLVFRKRQPTSGDDH